MLIPDLIERELSELSRNVDDPEVINNNLQYVKNLAKRNIPTLLIKSILDDENLLKKVATRSYEHVNHFDKIVLVDNNDIKGFRLTLHSWNGNHIKKAPDEELIHNHRFSFWSHIYQGNLLAENFIESPYFSIEKKTFNKYTYKPSNTGNIHSCEFDKKTQLIKLENSYISQGDTYYLNYNTTHRVILPKKSTNLCTFVLRGPRQREITNTYNTFYPDRGTESSVPMMNTFQLKEKLTTILKRL